MPQTTPEENIAIVHRWFEEVWNQQRKDTIHELLSPACIIRGAQEMGGDVHGPEGFLVFQARLLEAFPDMRIEIQDCVAAGDKVAVRWDASMHHQGAGLGMPPTGAAISITGISIARFAEGKVVEGWDNYDKLSMFQQIESAKAKSATA